MNTEKSSDEKIDITNINSISELSSQEAIIIILALLDDNDYGADLVDGDPYPPSAAIRLIQQVDQELLETLEKSSSVSCPDHNKLLEFAMNSMDTKTSLLFALHIVTCCFDCKSKFDSIEKECACAYETHAKATGEWAATAWNGENRDQARIIMEQARKKLEHTFDQARIILSKTNN